MDPSNPLPSQFQQARTMIELVARQQFVCTALSGGAGLGKTYTVEQTLKQLDVPYKIVRGSGPGLMLEAYNLSQGGVIVLDDADNLVVGGGVAQANLMKQLLAPDKVRVISNYTLAAAAGRALTPPEFRTAVGFVWLTNMDLSSKTSIAPKMRPHLDALLDRGLQPITLTNDPRMIVDYIVHLVRDEGLLQRGRTPSSLKEANDVLAYFVGNAWRLPTISVRVVEAMAKLRKAAPNNWRSILDGRLCSAPRYEFPLPPIPVIRAGKESVS